MVGIYKITNLITNECYVGQSTNIEKRIKDHFDKSYGARHNEAFQKAIDDLGIDGFLIEVLEECERDQLINREKHWIKVLKPEYNTVTEGHEVSQETREKIRKSLTGRKATAEARANISKGIRERNKIIPQTNAGHRKKVAIQEETAVREFESVKALAEYLKTDPASVTRALKRNWKIKGKKVWYVV